MVVLINYLHVMTILPSSILVNEIYIVPFRKDIVSFFTGSRKKLDKHGEASDDMNRLDRWLVQTYAPFVSRRPSLLIVLPVILVSSALEKFDYFTFSG